MASNPRPATYQGFERILHQAQELGGSNAKQSFRSQVPLYSAPKSVSPRVRGEPVGCQNSTGLFSRREVGLAVACREALGAPLLDTLPSPTRKLQHLCQLGGDLRATFH
jgi:hypothetical protein